MDWDSRAAVYDWQLWLERPALAAALDLASTRPEERLLDLGTGTGALLRELARREERPHEAVGVDASAAMLARAPTLPAGWSLREADVTALPFPDASFEVVTAVYLLHVLERETRRGALVEARRVLAAGGRLVTVTPTAPRSALAGPYRLVAAMVRGLR